MQNPAEGLLTSVKNETAMITFPQIYLYHLAHFVDMLRTRTLFVHRAAGVPFQAHQLLGADGERRSHSDASPRCPATADSTRPAYTGRVPQRLELIDFFSAPKTNCAFQTRTCS